MVSRNRLFDFILGKYLDVKNFNTLNFPTFMIYFVFYGFSNI